MDLYSDDEPDVTGWQLDDPSRLAILPRELLSEVFLLAIASSQGPRNVSKSRTQQIWHALQHFMSVCRYWRDVVLRSPILWREIGIGDGVSQRNVEMMLQRSGSAPLHLNIYYKDFGLDRHTSENIQELVVPELHRITHIHTRVLSKHKNHLLTETFNVPDLQELRVEIVDPGANGGPIPLVSPSYQLPVLSSLHTTGVLYRYASSFFRPTLRDLYLGTSTAAHTPPSVVGFLHALEGMPLLERLEIHSLFKALPPSDHKLLEVRFVALRSLRLYEDRVVCAQILDHVTLPLTVLSTRQFFCSGLSTHVPSIDTADSHIRFLSAIFTKLVDLTAAEPVLETQTSIHKSGFKGYIGEQDDDYNSRAPVFVSHADDWNPSNGRLLDRICSTAPDEFIKSVHTLTVRAHRFHTTPSSLFLRASPGYMNLEVLHLGNASGVWNELTRMHRGLEGSPSSPASLPFPKLRVLTLTDAKFRPSLSSPIDESGSHDEHFIQDLRDMVRVRKHTGIPLRMLGIYDAVHFESSDVEMLREYVGEVIWDGHVIVQY